MLQCTYKKVQLSLPAQQLFFLISLFRRMQKLLPKCYSIHFHWNSQKHLKLLTNFQLHYVSCYSFNSLAILEAMFLKAMDVPDIRLKRTPFRDSLGSLHTSISHCTRFSACPSPWTQKSKKRSLCSQSQLLASRTFRISLIISLGSMELVVFMLQVKRRDRGLASLFSSF